MLNVVVCQNYTFIILYPKEPLQTDTHFLNVLPQTQMENKKDKNPQKMFSCFMFFFFSHRNQGDFFRNKITNKFEVFQNTFRK